MRASRESSASAQVSSANAPPSFSLTLLPSGVQPGLWAPTQHCLQGAGGGYYQRCLPIPLCSPQSSPLAQSECWAVVGQGMSEWLGEGVGSRPLWL